MKRLKYRGDRTDETLVGDVLGPDAHGQHHTVTSVTYNPATDTTYVETRRITAPGQRIRYYGGRHAVQPPDYTGEVLPDEVKAK